MYARLPPPPPFRFALVALLMGLAMGSVRAQTVYSWTGAVDGSWTNAANWDANGVPVDFGGAYSPLTFPRKSGNRVQFNAVGSSNVLPTADIPRIGGHWSGTTDGDTPAIDLLHGGTLSLTLSAYQNAYWTRMAFTYAVVGDGDKLNGPATLNMAGVGMLNRDFGGIQSWIVNADGELNFASTGTLDVSYGAGRDSVITLNGGSVTVSGPVKDLKTFPGCYVEFTELTGSFAARFGQDFTDLSAVQAEIGEGLSFRSTVSRDPTAKDNGDGSFTVYMPAPGGTVLQLR